MVFMMLSDTREHMECSPTGYMCFIVYDSQIVFMVSNDTRTVEDAGPYRSQNNQILTMAINKEIFVCFCLSCGRKL